MRHISQGEKVMCKSKKSTNVVQPRNRNRNRNRSSSSSSWSAPPSTNQANTSSSNPSEIPITESRSYIFNNNKDYFTSSSISSHASLTSLKQHTLPENPNIYDISEITTATSSPSSTRLSTSSTRVSLRNRNVVVSQRKFRRQMNLEELQHRLAVISRSHHSSVVKLLGASVSGNYIYLVYEFVAGASLSECLRNRRNPSFTDLTTWISRMQIAADLAHGLDYIHNFSGSESGFVHNHIKSSSIVISEENFGAKICHFGTSDLCGEAIATSDGSGVRMRRLEGTRGYMAPEFQVSGVATQKSDVYAFGVVILEVLSGEEAVRFEFEGEDGGYRRVSVVETARVAAEEHGGMRKWVDRRLRDSFPLEVAERMIRVGLECVGEDPNQRPDMGRVAAEVSKLYLESQKWAEKMGTVVDFSVSLAPR